MHRVNILKAFTVPKQKDQKQTKTDDAGEEKGLAGFLKHLSPAQKHLWETVEWGGMDKLQSVLSIGGADKIAEEYDKLRQVRTTSISVRYYLGCSESVWLCCTEIRGSDKFVANCRHANSMMLSTMHALRLSEYEVDLMLELLFFHNDCWLAK